MKLTHQLRELFSAILVGIGTVVSDNPMLTARGGEGNHPQPVILDTSLRISSKAKLLQRDDCSAWLVCSPDHNVERSRKISSTCATVMPCSLNEEGMIDLEALGNLLYRNGIFSLMVEGGARVISNFLRAGLVDLLIVTIAPKIVGGLQVVDSVYPSGFGHTVYLSDIYYQMLGKDLILWATPDTNSHENP